MENGVKLLVYGNTKSTSNKSGKYRTSSKKFLRSTSDVVKSGEVGNSTQIPLFICSHFPDIYSVNITRSHQFPPTCIYMSESKKVADLPTIYSS